ncbi:hypothetical protein ACFL1O_00155 [Patescibacteria group bacterium]
MSKKALIITGIIVALIIIGLVWLFFFREPPKEGEEKGFLDYLLPTSSDKPTPSLPTLPDYSTGSPGTTTPPILIKGDLIQLVSEPVAGAVFNEELEKILYLKKTTGHLYEINPDGTARKQKTITTIPKIFETFWSQNSANAVLRYSDDETYTFLASFSTTTEGVFLPLNTSTTAVSPSGEKVFYLIKNEKAIGITSDFENKNKKELFELPFSEFLTDWPQKNIITLLTKPSAHTEGYLYKLHPQTGSFIKLLGGIKGLTTLHSPFNGKIIYSQSSNDSLTTNFGVKTLPEKCFFSQLIENSIYCAVPRYLPTADYPDDWYQGQFFFSDNLWKIDLDSGATEMFFDPIANDPPAGGFDIINLFSDTEENFLIFQNKKDLALWSLKIKN